MQRIKPLAASEGVLFLFRKKKKEEIVAKVDELMALCDELEKGLDEAEKKRERILKSVLSQVG